MTERFLSIFSFIDQSLGGAGVFLICVCVVFIVFVITLILAACKSNFNLKKRFWFFLVATAVVLCEYALSFFISGGAGYSFITAAFAVVLSIPVIAVRKKDNTAARDFARFLDQKIVKTNLPPTELQPTNFNTVTGESELQDQVPKPRQKSTAVNVAKKESNSAADLDFTHVKNVMARLEFYGLSPSEKKIIEGLDNAIALAENQQADQKTVSKINDGLGALLKIMSKYGV